MKARRMVAGALAGLAIAGAAAVPAQAVTYLYLYADSNFRGLIGKFSYTGIRNISAANNDSLSSWINQNNNNGAWFHDAWGRGHCVNMPAHSQDESFWILDNDKASSFRLDGVMC